MSAVKTHDSPSLQVEKGQTKTNNQKEDSIIVIRNHYLKNIRSELLEENTAEGAKQSNEIVYITRCTNRNYDRYGLSLIHI